MPRATLDPATSVAYTVFGEPAGPSTPDLVLVHGTGGSAVNSWAHLAEPFGAGAGRRIIALDYAGSGDTTDDGAPVTIEGLARQVRAVIAHAGDRPFDLLGFSLGACVSAHLAAHDAAGLQRLILLSGWVNSADDPRFAVQFGLWQHLQETDVRALAEMLALTGFSPAYLSGRPGKAVEKAIANTIATLAPGFSRQCELDRRIDLTATLPEITAATLVIGATVDQMVPIEHALALADGIPGAQFAELRTGHLSIYERPDLLAETVTAFLAR